MSDSNIVRGYRIDDDMNKLGLTEPTSLAKVMNKIRGMYDKRGAVDRNGNPRSYAARGVHKPILMLGPVGVGKTKGIEDLCGELGIQYLQVVLTNYQVTDLSGIPDIARREGSFTEEEIAAGKDRIVRMVQSGILPEGNPHAAGYRPEGILFLDEITNAAPSLQCVAWQLTDSTRGVGDYKLPDGWLVVLAGNGQEDGGSPQGITKALMSRCRCFRIEPDFNAWYDWALSHGIDDAVTSFISAEHRRLWSMSEEQKDHGSGLSPTPRSWEALSDELKNAYYMNSIDPEMYPLDADEVRAIAQSCVGGEEGMASAFASHWMLNDSLYTAEALVGTVTKDAPGKFTLSVDGDVSKLVGTQKKNGTTWQDFNTVMYGKMGLMSFQCERTASYIADEVEQYYKGKTIPEPEKRTDAIMLSIYKICAYLKFASGYLFRDDQEKGQLFCNALTLREIKLPDGSKTNWMAFLQDIGPNGMTLAMTYFFDSKWSGNFASWLVASGTLAESAQALNARR